MSRIPAVGPSPADFSLNTELDSFSVASQPTGQPSYRTSRSTSTGPAHLAAASSIALSLTGFSPSDDSKTLPGWRTRRTTSTGSPYFSFRSSVNNIYRFLPVSTGSLFVSFFLYRVVLDLLLMVCPGFSMSHQTGFALIYRIFLDLLAGLVSFEARALPDFIRQRCNDRNEGVQSFPEYWHSVWPSYFVQMICQATRIPRGSRRPIWSFISVSHGHEPPSLVQCHRFHWTRRNVCWRRKSIEYLSTVWRNTKRQEKWHLFSFGASICWNVKPRVEQSGAFESEPLSRQSLTCGLRFARRACQFW